MNSLTRTRLLLALRLGRARRLDFLAVAAAGVAGTTARRARRAWPPSSWRCSRPPRPGRPAPRLPFLRRPRSAGRRTGLLTSAPSPSRRGGRGTAAARRGGGDGTRGHERRTARHGTRTRRTRRDRPRARAFARRRCTRFGVRGDRPRLRSHGRRFLGTDLLRCVCFRGSEFGCGCLSCGLFGGPGRFGSGFGGYRRGFAAAAPRRLHPLGGFGCRRRGGDVGGFAATTHRRPLTPSASRPPPPQAAASAAAFAAFLARATLGLRGVGGFGRLSRGRAAAARRSGRGVLLLLRASALLALPAGAKACHLIVGEHTQMAAYGNVHLPKQIRSLRQQRSRIPQPCRVREACSNDPPKWARPRPFPPRREFPWRATGRRCRSPPSVPVLRRCRVRRRRVLR